jgi:hypothetical protein
VGDERITVIDRPRLLQRSGGLEVLYFDDTRVDEANCCSMRQLKSSYNLMPGLTKKPLTSCGM